MGHRTRLIILAAALLASPPTLADSARDACLIDKYKAHRDIARAFQLKQADILTTAIPEAAAAIRASMERQLAANDRLEIAFRHLLRTDRTQLTIGADTQNWLILSDTVDAALRETNTDYKAARARDDAARKAMADAGSVPKVATVAGAMMRDTASPLSVAMRATAEQIAANDMRRCD